ncbi:PREDICTED: U1 small nuclear ribonucleoprotein C-like, partial [Priapulus caudatus]|uniref:U1 small nuclear ribonucleoprotein C-like n=1 Tax=Priapulus caudatus TaxID=37621 RepID=A0ABM1F734_PRICU
MKNPPDFAALQTTGGADGNKPVYPTSFPPPNMSMPPPGGAMPGLRLPGFPPLPSGGANQKPRGSFVAPPTPAPSEIAKSMFAGQGGGGGVARFQQRFGSPPGGGGFARPPPTSAAPFPPFPAGAPTSSAPRPGAPPAGGMSAATSIPQLIPSLLAGHSGLLGSAPPASAPPGGGGGGSQGGADVPRSINEFLSNWAKKNIKPDIPG